MNLEVDMARVREIQDSIVLRDLNPDVTSTREDAHFAAQVQFVVRALVEQGVHVPRPEYTRESVSTIVRFAYYARGSPNAS